MTIELAEARTTVAPLYWISKDRGAKRLANLEAVKPRLEQALEQGSIGTELIEELFQEELSEGITAMLEARLVDYMKSKSSFDEAFDSLEKIIKQLKNNTAGRLLTFRDWDKRR